MDATELERRSEEQRCREREESKEWVKPSAELDHLTAETFYQSILPFAVKGLI